jgi:hypothetical protein
MLSKTPHRKGPRPERPPVLGRHGEAAAGRRGGRAEQRPASSEDLPADAVIALVAGAGLVLALATGGVMIKDSRSRPQAGWQAMKAPVVAQAPPAPSAPEAVEPRFPADQQQQQPQTEPQPQPQPLVQRDDKSETPAPAEPAEGEGQALAEVQPRSPAAGPKAYPAPVAPSVELLGPTAKPAPKTLQPSPIAPAPSGMRFAVYLASFPSDEQAVAGWQILQRRYQRPLAGLSPLVKRGKSKQGESVFRLFAGPFESLEAAARRCSVLYTATANCKPADLSQASAEGSQSWD